MSGRKWAKKEEKVRFMPAKDEKSGHKVWEKVSLCPKEIVDAAKKEDISEKWAKKQKKVKLCPQSKAARVINQKTNILTCRYYMDSNRFALYFFAKTRYT